MAESRRRLWMFALLAAVVLVVAGVGGELLRLYNEPSPKAGPATVVIGDNVTVQYIGVLGGGPQQGYVFDTSLLSVANDNVTWPKALEFSYRGNASQYAPLGVHVGPNSPSGGYEINNTTFGGVVTGFWQGMLGMAANQTKWVSIPPSLAYGPERPACLVTAPLVVSVPILTAVPTSNFTAGYPEVPKLAGTTFVDPTYGWTDEVFSVNSTTVTIQSMPTVGFTSSAVGWPVTVTAISGGNISVTNDITGANVGRILGAGTTSVCGQTHYIISAVNPANGTYTRDYNTQVTGTTLIFRITIVTIYP
jgi:FKBP-type peptidyl-prolyl cis-trans isomerase